MLPNRRRRDGLPVTPRSGPVGPPRHNERSSSYSRESSSRHEGFISESRYVRAQRLLGSMPVPQDRSSRPPMSQSQPAYRPYNSPRAYELPSANRKSDTSPSSVLQASLVNRLKSSDNEDLYTSLEGEYESLRSKRGHNSKVKDSRQLYQRNNREESSTTGASHILWDRLLTAAETLGLDISNTWAANTTLVSSEETPLGGESHLTRVMKAYHLKKARDPSDLPEWLFEEHERQPIGRLRFTGQQNHHFRDDYGAVSETGTHMARSRDIYTSAVVSTGRPNGLIANHFDDQPTTPSKATDRLKALRDAKRQKHRDAQGVEIADKKLPPRVGLPGPPRGRVRRY